MEFFAGANTRYGFKSIFEECLKSINRIYILKGSSGCGKSTFMRRVVERATVFGIDCDIIRCSADPDSLDGVILPQKSIAIIDGTSPHTMDVRYPCVRETIINLGEFWKEEKLISKREEIIKLTDLKSESYKEAYNYLCVVGKLNDIKQKRLSRIVLRSKLDEFLIRFYEKLLLEKHGERKEIFATAFTSDGVKSIPVFTNINLLYRINGAIANLFMVDLARIISEKGVEHIVSYSPIYPDVPDMIYFPENKNVVTSSDFEIAGKCDNEKIITTSRFTDCELLKSSKVKLHTLDRLMDELENDAKSELKNAKRYHNEIEKIYIPAMDFKLMDKFTFQFIDKIFLE